jgi:hypothetical protein
VFTRSNDFYLLVRRLEEEERESAPCVVEGVDADNFCPHLSGSRSYI